MHIAVLRVRGRVGVRGDINDTMGMLGIGRKHALAILKKSPPVMGMIKKSEDYITWGEISGETLEKLMEKSGKSAVVHLAPPKNGLKSLKKRWPKGDLGYRGHEMDKLVQRMIR